jgi:hypothetical protein
MDRGVGSACRQSKIRKAIVGAILVDVVDDVLGGEHPPDVLGHHETMLEDILVPGWRHRMRRANVDQDVSIARRTAALPIHPAGADTLPVRQASASRGAVLGWPRRPTRDRLAACPAARCDRHPRTA